MICLVAVAGQTVEGAVMTVVVKDAESGDPVPARCCVIDSLSQSRYPDLYNFLYHTYEDGYFYCDGDFALLVPEGPTVVRIARGPEYHPFIDTLTIHSDTTVTVIMERLIDMRQAGWYSGDVHVHIAHTGGFFELDPSDAHWMGQAEDLQFVNCLDNEFYFTGTSDAVSTEDCIVYMSEEQRNYAYGHCSLPGLKRLVEPCNTGWGTMLMDIADSVHTQDGPLMIYAHPVTTYDFDQIEDWPGSGLCRELPVDVISGRVDALDVMSYSNIDGGIELDMWYRLLNCGFRMPACAGTDAATSRLLDPPMGGYRVYVAHEGAPPDIYQWLEGIAAGRTFVTNGPLFTDFRVEGSLEAGDSLEVHTVTYDVTVDITAECAFPMERVDIVMNGAVVDMIFPGADPCVISGTVDFPVSTSCWIAARAVGRAEEWVTIGDDLFAHTGPVYIDMNAEPACRIESASFFVEWIDSLIALTLLKGDWSDPADSIRAFQELGAARDWYLDLMDMSTGTEDPAGGKIPAAPMITVYPNPFSDSIEIRFEAVSDLETGGDAFMSPATYGTGVEVSIYDLSGRLVRNLSMNVESSGRHSVTWDGRNDAGKEAASGIYFCRVRNGAAESSAKMLLIR
jgi:hypothetical protein